MNAYDGIDQARALAGLGVTAKEATEAFEAFGGAWRGMDAEAGGDWAAFLSDADALAEDWRTVLPWLRQEGGGPS